MNARALQKEETRARILKASCDLFKTSKSGSPLLKDIAKRAGVSIPSVLFHFGTRVELLEATAAELIAELADQGARPNPETTLELLATLTTRRTKSGVARAVWHISDEIAWQAPQMIETRAEETRQRIRDALVGDGCPAKDSETLADLLTPGVLFTARRIYMHNAPKRVSDQFVESARAMLEAWQAQRRWARRTSSVGGR